MTANQIRYNVLLAVDSLFENTGPGYNDTQMSYIINRAQRRVFRNKVKIFDSNEEVKRMLSPLLKRGSLLQSNIVETTTAAIIDYPHVTSNLDSTFYTLPVDVAKLVEETVILDSGVVKTDPLIVLPISYDYFLKNYSNRYKKPHIGNTINPGIVWRMDSNTETITINKRYVVEIIYPNTHTVDDYIISYLRYPANMVVVTGGSSTDCEITDQSFHDEIIGESVKLITAALSDGDYQTAAIEKNFDE